MKGKIKIDFDWWPDNVVEKVPEKIMATLSTIAWETANKGMRENCTSGILEHTIEDNKYIGTWTLTCAVKI